MSACIIVKNEADFVGRLLATLTELDDVVVVDTGSTDSTVEIASLFPNVRVRSVVWTNNFAAARNAAAGFARHDWVLWLDADMHFPPGELQKILSMVPQLPPQVDSASLRVHDVGSNTVFPSPRLYRRSRLSFRGAVHEDLSATCTCGTPFIVKHERIESEGSRAIKDAQYIGILRDELGRDPSSEHAHLYLRDAALNARRWSECAEHARALPDDYMSHYCLARIAYEHREWHAVITHGFDALKRCSMDPRVYCIIADAFDELGKKVDALCWYEHAFRLPDEARLVSGKYAVSADDYTVVPLVNRAKVYADLGMREKALSSYDEALRLQPQTRYRENVEWNIRRLA